MSSPFPIATLNCTCFFFSKRDDSCLGRRFASQKLAIIEQYFHHAILIILPSLKKTSVFPQDETTYTYLH